jgi:hypothetical protein
VAKPPRLTVDRENGELVAVLKLPEARASPAMASPPPGRDVEVSEAPGPIARLPAPDTSFATAVRSSSVPAAATLVGPLESAVGCVTCSVPEETVTPPMKVLAVPSTITPGPSVVRPALPETAAVTTSGKSVLLFRHFWDVPSTIFIADVVLVGVNCVVPVALALTMMP